MRHFWRWLIVLLLLGGAWRCLLFVDETQFVIVTQFGRPVRTIDEAGLHFKLPYQSWLGIDRRLQIYSNPRPAEFLAAEKKNVNLDVFVCWQVEQAQRFVETVGDAPAAEARIHDIVWSELAAEVGRSPIEALLSIDPAVHRLDQIAAGVAQRCDQRASQSYGLRIVDVRLRRIGFPTQVLDSVFQRMRTERSKIAERYRSEGRQQAMQIRAEADKQRTIILAQAYGQDEKVRGQAEADAIRIYGQAHQKDPAFYELLRTLESYKKILDDKTTLLLSGDSELLKYLSGNRKPETGNRKEGIEETRPDSRPQDAHAGSKTDPK